MRGTLHSSPMFMSFEGFGKPSGFHVQTLIWDWMVSWIDITCGQGKTGR